MTEMKLLVLADENRGDLQEEHENFEQMEKDIARIASERVIAVFKDEGVLQRDCDREKLRYLLDGILFEVYSLLDTFTFDLVDNQVTAKVGLLDKRNPDQVIVKDKFTRIHNHVEESLDNLFKV